MLFRKNKKSSDLEERVKKLEDKEKAEKFIRDCVGYDFPLKDQTYHAGLQVDFSNSRLSFLPLTKRGNNTYHIQIITPIGPYSLIGNIFHVHVYGEGRKYFFHITDIKSRNK